MKVPALACLVLASTLAWNARANDADDVGDTEPNPLPRRISLPFENIFQLGVGPNDELKYSLKIKSVFPLRLSDGWHLFHRPIVQITAQPSPKPGEAGAFGLGDLEYQLYLAPPASKDFIWGLGPDLWFPTATAMSLGTGKAAVGVAGAFHFELGSWTFGAIVTQHWSYAGDPNRSAVTELTLQPHVTFHLPRGFYLTSSPILTADWNAGSGQVWTIPVGGGGGWIFDVAGEDRFNAQFQTWYSVAHPDFAGRWQMRLTLQWLFPRRA
jgi:hypothetical protein